MNRPHLRHLATAATACVDIPGAAASLPLDKNELARQLADLDRAEAFERTFDAVFHPATRHDPPSLVFTPRQDADLYRPGVDTPRPRIRLAVARPATAAETHFPTLRELTARFDVNAWTPSYLVFRDHVIETSTYRPLAYSPLRIEHVVDPDSLELPDAFTPVASLPAPLPRGIYTLSDFPGTDAVRVKPGTIVAFEWLGPDPTPEQLAGLTL